MRRSRPINLFFVAAAFACMPSSAHAAEIINNGGFETGLTGWVTFDQFGGDGSFFLQTGISSPVTSVTVAAPPSGTRAAMTDSEGPGAHLLYQDFFVSGPVGSAILTFNSFIGNRASSFFNPSPASLDFAAAAFNQQARVDIISSAAPAFSVAPGDIVFTALQTNPGDPTAVSGYRTISANVTTVWNANLNSTLRLRFAETDNVAPFEFGVDNVSLVTNNAPEPATIIFAVSGMLSISIVRLRRCFANLL